LDHWVVDRYYREFKPLFEAVKLLAQSKRGKRYSMTFFSVRKADRDSETAQSKPSRIQTEELAIR
jgi:hypothetical protein